MLSKVLTFGLFLAVTSSSAATIQNFPLGVTLNVGGVDETAVLGLPAFAIGRNSFNQTTPIAVANLFAVTGLSFSTFNDPFINFSGGFTNNTTSNQTFTMSFISDFIGGPYNLLQDSFQSGVTDGNGNGVITISPANASGFSSQPQVNGSNVDGQGLGCSFTGNPGFSQTCTPGGPILNSGGFTSGATGNFGTVVSVTVSPGDIYTFNGRVNLANTTPEPSTWAMMVTGLGALAFGAVRRNRKA